VFYPFHPLSGRTLAVVTTGTAAVTVVGPDERHLKIPTWMTRPQAAGFEVSAQAAIEPDALFALRALLKSEESEAHATLCESETTPATGGEDETVGACAGREALEDEERADGRIDEAAAGARDGGDGLRSRSRKEEGRR
jgi:hypothetical protein